MRRLLIVALLLLACPAQAQMSQTIVNDVHHSGGAAYSGPGDVVASASAWWGLRAYSSATRGNNSINLCNVSDVVCSDVATDGTTGSINPDPIIGGVTCGSTVGVNVCTIKTWYDQTGNGNNQTQATISKRAVFTVNAVGSLPCATFAAGSSQVYATVGNISVSQPITFSGVGKRTGNTGNVNSIIFNNDTNNDIEFGFLNSVNTMYQFSGSSVASVSASDNAFHAAQAINNGASSSINVDGSSGSGSGTAPLAGTSVSLGGSNIDSSHYTTGSICESGIWPSAFSGGNITSMNSNQHTYWGF